VVLDPPPPFPAFLQELQTPSLFATERLLLVPDAKPYLALSEPERRLLEALPDAAPGVVWAGLFALASEPPGAPWRELPWLEATHLAVPPPPKPWEELRLSREQRQLLLQLLAAEVPEVMAHAEVVEALLAAHGFSPRQLVQAARGLVASGELSAAAARQTVGRETVALGELERPLAAGELEGAAYSLARLAAGASLESFRGEVASGRRAADVVAGVLARTCLAALTLRLLAQRAGLSRELSPAKVADPSWYPREFKPRILPALLRAAEASPELALADRSPWALQASFRVAAQFSTEKLLKALTTLLRAGGLRAEGGEPWAPVVLAYASLFAASRSW